MAMLWKKFKSFIGRYDFGDALKSVADDLRLAAGAMFGLGVLSLLPRLPEPLLTLSAAVGMSAVSVSAWVTWLLFAVGTALYVAQFWLRVSRRPKRPQRDVQQSQIESIQDGQPRGRRVPDGRRRRTGLLASAFAQLFERGEDPHH